MDVGSTAHTPSGSPVRDSHDFAPGDTTGDYRIERKLGQGGMGAVYEAFHPVIEKRVAIKVLRHELSANEEAVSRFVQEAKAINRIGHPSIVDVYGFGTTDDGRSFLVMELLSGHSLGDHIAKSPPHLAEACSILIEITHALEAAHARGIVHRDLKPDNVFLVGDSRVKLLDFGIAKLLYTGEGHAPADHTQPGSTIGTPRYIAPEQARGDQIDGRTDIYSLGVMAYEMIVGRLPFESENPMELIAKHITVEPPRPSEVEPGLPPLVDELLLDMLSKQPEQRPTLARIRDTLDQLRGQPQTIRGSTPRLLTPAAAVAATQLAPIARRRGRAWVAGLAAGVVVAAIVIGWSVIREDTAASNAVPPNAAVDTAAKPAPPPLVAEPPPAPPPTPVVEPALDAEASEPVKKRPKRRAAKTVKPDKPAPVVVPAPPPAVEKPPVPEDPDALRKPTFKPKPK
jgi:serine/threonine-protein kinase